MVSNYSSGKRRFDCYAQDTEALEAATTLARKLSSRDVLAAEMTNEQTAGAAAATQSLEPYGVSLPAGAAVLADCLKLVGGDLLAVHMAVKEYVVRHKQVVGKPVTKVVDDLIAVKTARGASDRYLQDLRFRLRRFAGAFHETLPMLRPPRFRNGWIRASFLHNRT